MWSENNLTDQNVETEQDSDVKYILLLQVMFFWISTVDPKACSCRHVTSLLKIGLCMEFI